MIEALYNQYFHVIAILGWLCWCIYLGTHGMGGMDYWFFRLLFGTPVE